ncbi:MAG TPA: hypothetical protein DCS73_02680 [Roseburia sp.]|nr:hypothetical protein [Roseburia sp.]
MISQRYQKGSDFTDKDKELKEDQISDAKHLSEIINSVSSGKRSIFESVMLAYLNGMEAGMVYGKDDIS